MTTTEPTVAEPVSRPYDDDSIETITERVAILSALIADAGVLRAMHRAALERRLGRGNKCTVFGEDGQSTLGSASMSNPLKDEAYVTDRAEFEKHCRAVYPDKVEDWWEFIDPEAAAQIVRERAPHLVLLHQGVSKEAEEAALAAAVTTEVPGTARKKKDPQLTISTTPHTRAAVKALLDSMPALRGLEIPAKTK
ncbi:hypothetical protein [Nocardia asiatica]|uniref:hypothetical protein n=1 Tax=Nocardia asiatica TaxID=209252 RepID=UPI0024557DCC|nr:hypothetical protein [Nocardia asiatica]